MKKIITLFILLSIIGCFHNTRNPSVITKNVYLYPDIPKLNKLDRPDLTEFYLNKQVINNEINYCLSKSDTKILINNISLLKNKIEKYEKMIDEYNKFYNEYQIKKNSK